MSNALFELFQKQGTEKALEASKPFSLSQEEVIWAVENPPIELFIGDALPSRVRFFLTSSPFCFLFPVSAQEEHSLIAASSSDTKAFCLPKEKFIQELENNPALLPLFLKAMRDWASLLTLTFAEVPPDNVATTAFLQNETRVEEGRVICFPKTLYPESENGAFWIEVVQGELLSFGKEELALLPNEKIYPICGAIWLLAKTQSEIKLVNKETFQEQKLFGKALFSLSEFFHNSFKRWLEVHKAQEKNLLQLKDSEQQNHFDLALKRLEEVLTEPEIPIVKPSDDSLNEACSLLGNYLGIHFRILKKRDKRSRDETLKEIASNSQVFLRKVALEENWFHEINTPLLAFYGSDEKPVVLIQDSSQRIWKVEIDQKMRLTPKIAQQFAKDAYSFYFPTSEDVTNANLLVKSGLAKQKGELFRIGFYSLLSLFVSFFFPLATKTLFTYAIPESDLPFIGFLSLGLLFAAFGSFVFYFFRSLAILRFQGILFHFLSTSLWQKLLQMPYSFFRKYTAGTLYSRVSAIDEIEWILSSNAINLILSGILAPLYLIMLFVYSPILSLVVLTGSALGFSISFYYAKEKIKALRTYFDLRAEIRGFIIQIISGIGKLRTTGREKDAFSHWAMLYAQNKQSDMRARTCQNRAITGFAFTVLIVTFGIYWMLISGIGIGQLSLPDFLAFNVALGLFTVAFYQLGRALLSVCAAVPLWNRTDCLFEEKPEILQGKTLPGRLLGAIAVDNASFSYPTSGPILSQISMTIAPREFIAIVGKSGSGKSTLLNLLLGLEKPTSGAVYYDDKDLATLDLQAVRSQIGSILQGDELVSGSLYDNLTMGRKTSKEQIMRAIKLAGFERDFSELPMGLNTYVPMNGVGFSGGQRQRILLAKVLLRNPSILVLDEATSALDNKTQEEIIHTLDSLNVTRIVVAQRLSTIVKADKIYVIDQGKIAEVGTFKELTSKAGIFAEMVKRQVL